MSTETHGDSAGDSEYPKMKRSGKGKKSENLARLAQLNPVYHKHDFKQKLGDAFRERHAFDHGEFILLRKIGHTSLFTDDLKHWLLSVILYCRRTNKFGSPVQQAHQL